MAFTYRKKRTRFHNPGRARGAGPAHYPVMKLETLPVHPNSALIKIKKILVPVDFSSLSKKAFNYALRLAQQFKAELTVLMFSSPQLR